jgi:membrane-associated phospholipid phosphatase
MAARHDTTPYKGHQSWYIAGFIASLVIFGVTLFLVLNGDRRATGWEYTWFMAINNGPEWLRGVMSAISFVATPGILAAVSVVGVFLLRYYRLAARLAVSIVAAYGVTYVLKDLFDRARPGEMFTTMHARVHETDAAFPSGHTTAITVVALTLLPYLPRKLQWLVPLAILLVGLSRIYLGGHLPLDVVAGFAVSLGVVTFIRLLPQSLRVALRID